MRAEVRPLGVEIVTVALESLGADAARPFVEAAQPEHPSLIDVAHVVDERFGVINIPNAVWIDEHRQIVRPAEPAWPAPREARTPTEPAEGTPQRFIDIMEQASGIVAWTADGYADAVRDWATNGADSRFVLSADEVISRSGSRGLEESLAAAHFAIAEALEERGDHPGAIEHFAAAHRLAPDNWTYKRQAWSIEPSIDGPLGRLWQGPVDGHEWPYESDWLSDIRASGAANYYGDGSIDI